MLHLDFDYLAGWISLQIFHIVNNALQYISHLISHAWFFFFMLHKKTTDAVLQLELLLCLTVSLAPEFVHWPSKDMIQKHHHEANTQILYVSKIDLIALFFLTTLKQKLT